MPRRKRGFEIRPTDELRLKHARLFGEMLGKHMEIACFLPVWMRWTVALRFALNVTLNKPFDVHPPVEEWDRNAKRKRAVSPAR